MWTEHQKYKGSMKRMKQPFFSVVLPIYNVEKYLNRCIESIITQDFDDYELILVDDGSYDNCPKICDDWCKKDSRIRVIHKDNAGLGMARNTGIDNARGKYIFFFDSDDYILPGLLSDVFNNICKTSCDAVFFGMKRISDTGKELALLVPNPEKDFYDNKNEIMNKLFPDFLAMNPHTGRRSWLRISVCTCCLSMEFLKQNKLRFVSEREYISEDIYFYIEMFSKLRSVVLLKNIYYVYYQNAGSLTFSYKSDRYERTNKFYSDMDCLIKKLGYDKEVNIRMQAVYISAMMSVLKMEAANMRNVGYIKAYQGFRNKCLNQQLQNAVNMYPKTYMKRTWKIFCMCISKKIIIALFIITLLQYCKRKV